MKARVMRYRPIAIMSAWALISSSIGLVPTAIAPQATAAKPALSSPERPNRCAAITRTSIPNVEIVSATEQLPNTVIQGTKTFLGVPVSGLPGFCRVVARAHPARGSDVGFEVWMPRDGWDGRLHGIGVGGFAGLIDHGSLATAVQGGQAGMATDTGHRGVGLTDASWAKGHPERVRDYGWRAVHASTVAAKLVIAEYYGRGPKHSYFVGCSGGGRQGLMQAALFPEDYDGVLAGAPAASWTDLAIAMTNVAQAQLPAGAAIRADQMDFLQEQVLLQCDRVDRLADGLIADPRQCRFKTARLACGTAKSPKCFSPPQILALERIYAGPRRDDGRQLTPGYLPAGSEAGYVGWPLYISADASGHSGAQVHVDGLFQNFIQEPFPTAATFDFNKHPPLLKAYLSRELDAPANLRRFFARGGRLILWHGWGDAAIPPGATLRYHAAMLKESGPLAGHSSRLFMVPNVQHCFGGEGPASFGQLGAPPKSDTPENNMVSALQYWVENKRAPEQLIATMGTFGFHGQPPQGVKRQRLLCAWPAKSDLAPGGSPQQAASYTCRPGRQ